MNATDPILDALWNMVRDAADREQVADHEILVKIGRRVARQRRWSANWKDDDLARRVRQCLNGTAGRPVHATDLRAFIAVTGLDYVSPICHRECMRAEDALGLGPERSMRVMRRDARQGRGVA